MSVFFCIFAFSGLVAVCAVQTIRVITNDFSVERSLAGEKCSTEIK